MSDLTWVLAIDMSESSIQSAADLSKTKSVASAMLEETRGSSVALVAVAGTAHWVLPPTQDSNLLLRYLEALEPSLMPIPAWRADALAKTVLEHPSYEKGAPIVLISGRDSREARRVIDTFETEKSRILVKSVSGYRSGFIALELNRATKLSGEQLGLALDRWLVMFALLLSIGLWRKDWSRAIVSSWILLCLIQPLETWAQTDLNAPALPDNSAIEVGLGLLLSSEQQGWLWLQLEQPGRAARHFTKPLNRAWAHYLAGEFREAAVLAATVSGETARFLEANAWAHGNAYGRAIDVYDNLLATNPQHQEAKHNRAQVWALVQAAAEQGESQRPDMGELVRLESSELDSDQVSQSDEMAVMMTLEAERLLSDPEALKRWRAQVEADPKRFLANRFSREAQGHLSRQDEQSAEGGSNDF